MSARLHDDELGVDEAVVRHLLAEQAPHLAHLPLRRLPASGSSNALFRLGDDLLVRLPRQPGGSETILKEQRWSSTVAPHLPVAVPEVVAVGEPGPGYPESWSVVRWLDGDVPAAGGAAPDLARDLAGLVVALRDAAPPATALADPALRGYRGEPLAVLDADTRENLEACRSLPGLGLDLDLAARVWDDAMRQPGSHVAGPDRWLHGDLLAENLLAREGRLAAVLDLGGLSVGDPTVDLVVAWEALDAPSREVFRRAVDVDDETWLRGRAWALGLALMTFPYYWTSMPQRCADRLVMARAVLDDLG